MRKVAVVFLVSSALVLSIAVPGEARGSRVHSRTRVIVGVGPAYWWGWGPYPYWWYYPPPPYYVSPAPVVMQEPPVYIQQSVPPVAPPPAPPAAPAAPTPELHWYYCPSTKTYYPMVQACPEPWVKVPPRP